VDLYLEKIIRFFSIFANGASTCSPQSHVFLYIFSIGVVVILFAGVCLWRRLFVVRR
jgi:hypothetical protein